MTRTQEQIADKLSLFITRRARAQIGGETAQAMDKAFAVAEEIPNRGPLLAQVSAETKAANLFIRPHYAPRVELQIRSDIVAVPNFTQWYSQHFQTYEPFKLFDPLEAVTRSELITNLVLFDQMLANEQTRPDGYWTFKTYPDDLVRLEAAWFDGISLFDQYRFRAKFAAHTSTKDFETMSDIEMFSNIRAETMALQALAQQQPSKFFTDLYNYPWFTPPYISEELQNELEARFGPPQQKI